MRGLPHVMSINAEACRRCPQGDEETLRAMLGGGRRVLAQSVDENRRRWSLARKLCYLVMFGSIPTIIHLSCT